MPNDIEKSSVNYTENEYNESLKRIKELESKIEKVFIRCEYLCKVVAKSSWNIKSTDEMADHCANLIRGQRLASIGAKPTHLSVKHEVITLSEWKKKRKEENPDV